MLRADARENRQRIVAAARATFAERGLDVPMSVIARRSGVGAATLYRRFPTKESLVTEAFADQLGHCAAVVDAAAAPGPARPGPPLRHVGRVGPVTRTRVPDP